jgi:hypothetical protein
MRNQRPSSAPSRLFRRGAFWLLAGCVLWAAQAVRADDWPAPRPRVFASADARHGFKLLPAKPGIENLFGDWDGRLFRVNDDGSDAILWQARMVCAPHQVFVSNSGAVVTVDQHGSVGYEHSLVVYGEAGKVLADYALEDLLSEEEIRDRVSWSVSSRWWTREAKFSLDEDRGRFVIEMSWGKKLELHLADGALQ